MADDFHNSRAASGGHPGREPGKRSRPSWPPAGWQDARVAPRRSNEQPRPAVRETGRLRRAFFPVFIFVLLLWWLQIFSDIFAVNLWALGIRPGEWIGLAGVLAAPLIHGGWEHLVANTLPLLILGTLLLYSYPRAARWVVPLVWAGSGLGVWFFGASGSVHAGASGLTHGLMFFLFVVGVLRRDRRAMAIAMAVFFLYGGMVMTIFPREAGISWEAHMFGAIPGFLLAFVLFRLDAAPPRKVYSWELEEAEEADDPVIGDLWKHPHRTRPRVVDEEDEVPLEGDDEEERW